MARPEEQWLDEWVKLGEAATRGLPGRPAATAILAADRERLEKRSPKLLTEPERDFRPGLEPRSWGLPKPDISE
jgi:hypothetical protein